MSHSYITSRTNNLSSLDELKKLYQNYPISDLTTYSYSKNVHVAFSSKYNNVPINDYLFRNSIINDFLNSLNDAYVLISENEILINNAHYEMNDEMKEVINKAITYFAMYGGYLNDKGEHIYNLKSLPIGPHFSVNLLLGDASYSKDALLSTPKSVVDSFGSGSFRGGAAYQVLATRWDMDPSENGNPFNRQFYILENNKQIFYSHDVSNIKDARCIHSVNKTTIEYDLDDSLTIRRIITLLPSYRGSLDAVESQIVEIVNKGNNDRRFNIVFTGMFGSSNPGCQMVDVIYQSVINQTGVLMNENKEIKCICPDYYPSYCKDFVRFFALKDETGYAKDFSYDVLDFIGNGSINRPAGLTHLNNKFNVKGPSFFALGKEINVLKGKTYEILTLTGCKKVEDEDVKKTVEEDINNYLDNIDVKKVKNINKQARNKFDAYKSYLSIDGNNNYATYVNNNLPFQILYQTYVSRAFAQTQKGYREIGFREIQDIYSSMLYYINNGQINLVKTLLSKWISNVYKMGYVNHNFFYVGKEPGMCSDDGLWLIDAIYRYLLLTNDYDFLNQRFKIEGSKNKRSLYETLKAIIQYSSKISVGKHDIPLLDKADWNDCLKIDDDCLDGLQKEALYKKQLKRNKQPYGVRFESELAESVMNGFLLVIMLDDMICIANHIKDEAYVEELKATKDNLVKSLKENAYINGYYARVLINRTNPRNGITYIGAPKDGLSLEDNFDGTLYLNSLSWSILSGVASEEEIASMISLADAHLKTPFGYRLCTKHNLTLAGSKEAATEQYFAGDRENGGIFKHATMMFARSLFMANRYVNDVKLKETLLNDAYYMLDFVYPYNVYQDLYKMKGNPRYCTQYVNSLTGEHIGPILSGTSTWLLLTIIEYLGIVYTDGGFKLHPALEKKLDNLSFTLRHGKSTYKINITKAANEYGHVIKNMTLDGNEISKDHLFVDDNKNHIVNIKM